MTCRTSVIAVSRASALSRSTPQFGVLAFEIARIIGISHLSSPVARRRPRCSCRFTQRHSKAVIKNRARGARDYGRGEGRLV